MAGSLTARECSIVQLGRAERALRIETEGSTAAFAFARDGVVVAGDEGLTVPGFSSGEPLMRLSVGGLQAVAVSDPTFATANEKEVVLWGLRGEQLGRRPLETGVAALVPSGSPGSFVVLDRAGRAFAISTEGRWDELSVELASTTELALVGLAPDASAAVAAVRADRLELRTGSGDTYVLSRADTPEATAEPAGIVALAGRPEPRGATWDGEGTNFSLFS